MLTDAQADEITSRILGIARPHPTRVGFDGIDAAGKTTLADEIAGRLAGTGRQVIRASLDGFHHPREYRYRRGEESPEGYYRDSFNYDSLIMDLLQPLGPGGDRRYRTEVFEFKDDVPVHQPFQIAEPDAVLLVDGIFLQRSLLRRHWDFCIYVRVSFDTALARAVNRDEGSADLTRSRYLARYFPGQGLYLDECHPELTADIIIENERSAGREYFNEG